MSSAGRGGAMGTAPNVFISWSGPRGLLVAKALRSWLPKVIQAARPWMSDSDIDKGARGLAELSKALASIRVGITCLTPENLGSPWLLFEAGALSKSIDDNTRLCTYLFGELNFQDIRAPLSMFQATRADLEDTRKLIHSVNRALQDVPIPEADLDELFDAMWPSLDKKLSDIPEPEDSVVVKRSTEDMVAEILEWSRAESQRRREVIADIVSQFASDRPDRGPTLDVDLIVNNHPLHLQVAGLPDLVEPMIRPALVDFLKGQIGQGAHEIRIKGSDSSESESGDNRATTPRAAAPPEHPASNGRNENGGGPVLNPDPSLP